MKQRGEDPVKVYRLDCLTNGGVKATRKAKVRGTSGLEH